MSKNFKYKNGHIGVVSDAVAEILETQGEGEAVKGLPEAPKAAPKDEKK